MKVGDIVEIWKVNGWGGRLSTEKFGIVLERTVLAYNPKNSQWRVLIDGEVRKIKENSLRKVCK